MSTGTPRHRGELTPAQRKHEREVMLALVFLVGAGVYLVLLTTVWDRGATALGILLCGVIGTVVQIRRDRRVRRRAAEEHPGSGGTSVQGGRDMQA